MSYAKILLGFIAYNSNSYKTWITRIIYEIKTNLYFEYFDPKEGLL
jgi:hypothetical protein